MSNKWVGIFAPKLLYPHGEEVVEDAKSIPGLPVDHKKEEFVLSTKELYERVAKELIEKGVNTIAFDIDDLEVVDDKLKITSGSFVINEHADMPENGIEPNIVYNRYINLNRQQAVENGKFQAKNVWKKFGKDQEKILQTHSDVCDTISRVFPVDKEWIPFTLDEKDVSLPFYNNIAGGVVMYLEATDVPVLPPLRSNLMAKDKWNQHQGMSAVIEEEASVKDHKEYDFYIPKTAVIEKGMKELTKIVQGSVKWLKAQPLELQKGCVGVVKPMRGTEGERMKFPKDSNELKNVCKKVAGEGYLLQEYVPLRIRKDTEIDELKDYYGRPVALRVLIDRTNKKPIVFAYIGDESSCTSHAHKNTVLIEKINGKLEHQIKKLYQKIDDACEWCRKEYRQHKKTKVPLSHLGMDIGLAYRNVTIKGQEKVLKYLVFIEINEVPHPQREILPEYSKRVAEDLIKYMN